MGCRRSPGEGEVGGTKNKSVLKYSWVALTRLHFFGVVVCLLIHDILYLIVYSDTVAVITNHRMSLECLSCSS